MKRVMLILAILAMTMVAQDEIVPKLEGTINIYRIAEDNKLEPVEENSNVKPGEVLKYEIVYVNVGDDVAKEAAFIHPVPVGTEYIDESAEGGVVQFSVDNGETYMAPPVKYEVEENGEMIEKIAQPSQYTMIKWLWQKDIDKEENAKVSFKVKVREGER